MPTSYQPRRGGVIEIVSEKGASEMIVDLNQRPDSSEYVEPEEKFINEYIQQNSKRVQSASSTLTSNSSSTSQDQPQGDEVKETPPKTQRSARHASAHRLFEVNEWEEHQKRIKHKRQTGNSTSITSYDEIKAATKTLLEDYEKLVDQSNFEAHRRREFIYRNYRCNVREPFLLAKFKQLELMEKTRSDRTRFQAQQYNQFLQFINKHHFITQDDYDKDTYDAMARYDNQSEIRTSPLSDPTLLPYHKWLNERRTMSSVGPRHQREITIDPRRILSEQGFRSFHRTATPFSDGRSMQSALSWQMHVQTNIDSPMRRLASAKCYHIEQKSQDPTSFDPADRLSANLDRRSISSAASTVTIRSRPPLQLTS